MAAYTPIEIGDRTKEKEWAYQIGLLDWDSTKIVFTKRSLIEFLKYTGVTVDTNMTNIQKLPRYAEFGTITKPENTSPPIAPSASNSGPIEDDPASAAFKPTRRVRDAPGGTQTFRLFEDEFADDALSAAPPRSQAPPQPAVAQPSETLPAPTSSSTVGSQGTSDETVEGNAFRPTRRVRTGPGGPSTLGGLFGGDPVEDEGFKPTRRVRQGPGGADHITGIF